MIDDLNSDPIKQIWINLELYFESYKFFWIFWILINFLGFFWIFMNLKSIL